MSDWALLRCCKNRSCGRSKMSGRKTGSKSDSRSSLPVSVSNTENAGGFSLLSGGTCLEAINSRPSSENPKSLSVLACITRNRASSCHEAVSKTFRKFPIADSATSRLPSGLQAIEETCQAKSLSRPRKSTLAICLSLTPPASVMLRPPGNKLPSQEAPAGRTAPALASAAPMLANPNPRRVRLSISHTPARPCPDSVALFQPQAPGFSEPCAAPSSTMPSSQPPPLTRWHLSPWPA